MSTIPFHFSELPRPALDRLIDLCDQVDQTRYRNAARVAQMLQRRSDKSYADLLVVLAAFTELVCGKSFMEYDFANVLTYYRDSESATGYCTRPRHVKVFRAGPYLNAALQASRLSPVRLELSVPWRTEQGDLQQSLWGYHMIRDVDGTLSEGDYHLVTLKPHASDRDLWDERGDLALQLVNAGYENVRFHPWKREVYVNRRHFTPDVTPAPVLEPVTS